MATYASSNEQSLWISAVSNRLAVNTLCVDHERNSQSMFNLIERINDCYFRIPSGKLSSWFMPVYNPQDKSQWPELLGWLIKVGEMKQVAD